MSFLSSRVCPIAHDSKTFAPSVTLMVQSQTSENGRYINRSDLQEFFFAEQPYSTISIDEFSINAILANGGNPHATFYASNDVDSVINAVDNLRKTLTPDNND